MLISHPTPTMKHTIIKHTFLLRFIAIASLAIGLNYAAPAFAEELKTPLAANSPTTKPEYLASNCTNCHSTQPAASAQASAIPSLKGLSADYIAEQLHAFRDGKRTATVMHQLAKGYTDSEITALATYFASVPK
jgi:cytochrome subunit of sulfide dehydrogenase